jgi:hypothetical protein
VSIVGRSSPRTSHWVVQQKRPFVAGCRLMQIAYPALLLDDVGRRHAGRTEPDDDWLRSTLKRPWRFPKTAIREARASVPLSTAA